MSETYQVWVKDPLSGNDLWQLFGQYATMKGAKGRKARLMARKGYAAEEVRIDGIISGYPK